MNSSSRGFCFCGFSRGRIGSSRWGGSARDADDSAADSGAFSGLDSATSRSGSSVAAAGAASGGSEGLGGPGYSSGVRGG